MGANMRLGARWVEFTKPEESLVAALYGVLAEHLQASERSLLRSYLTSKPRRRQSGHGATQTPRLFRRTFIQFDIGSCPCIGYEFNVAFKERMEKKGLIFSGQDESKDIPQRLSCCLARGCT